MFNLKGEDIEIAFTHTNQYGEEYYSFVNGQHTTQGLLGKIIYFSKIIGRFGSTFTTCSSRPNFDF